MLRTSVLAMSLAGVTGQQVGTMTAERHPQLSIQQCSKAGGCTEEQKALTIDANWRWTHQVGQAKNCYSGSSWDPTLCPDAATCTQNCALEGAGSEYTSTYGVNANGAEVRLQFVTQGPYSKNIGSRSYLMEDEATYKLFKLKNREFAFDVDVSKLPCGLNGALYFVGMDADGGLSKYPGNKAGAKFGTGYCDAQCPHDIKFINGVANSEGWKPSASDPNSGVGRYGTCCVEMDIWEANSIGSAYTAHSCTVSQQTRCDGTQCGDDPDHRFDGVCDKNGCDINAFRLGNKTFFGSGPGFAVDTTKPVTVVTQFITEGNTDSGALTEIRRHYKQGGRIIETPSLNVGAKKFNSISNEMCQAEVALFADKTNFLQKGGMKSMETALEKGLVLVVSLWDDHAANMQWLDSNFPVGGDPSKPGVARGTCSASSGKPADVEAQHPDASVTFSKIRYGEIGTTDAGPSPGPSPGPAPGPSPSGCPGGSLSACMNLCPSDPTAFQACVKICQQRCKSQVVV